MALRRDVESSPNTQLHSAMKQELPEGYGQNAGAIQAQRIAEKMERRRLKAQEKAEAKSRMTLMEQGLIGTNTMVKVLFEAFQRGQFLPQVPQPIQTAPPGTHGASSSHLQIEAPSAHHLGDATPPPSIPGILLSGPTLLVFPPIPAPVISDPDSPSPQFQVVSRVEPTPSSPSNVITTAESGDAVLDVPIVDARDEHAEVEVLTTSVDVTPSISNPTPPFEPLPTIADSDMPAPMDTEPDPSDLPQV